MTNKYKSFEVEIGCGKGEFLVARALGNPHLFFIGIDKAGKWIKRGAIKAEKNKLENLKFIKGEAKEVVPILPLESVSVFHIYFPDPWPKRRHHRRRLLTADFFRVLYDRLANFGQIEIATDDLDYFQAIENRVKQAEVPWQKIRASINEKLFPAEQKTNYEEKYRAQGKPIYYLELQK